MLPPRLPAPNPPALALALFALVAPLSAQGVFTFANNAGIDIPMAGNTAGNADPFPSTVFVTGVNGTVTSVAVGLVGLSHTWPDDIDIFLVAPSGLAVKLLSDAGDGSDVNGINPVFFDSAPGPAPDAAALATTFYQPTDYETGDAVPPGVISVVDSLLGAAVGGVNGTWSLYIVDDASGDAGGLTAWDIEFTTADREFRDTGAMDIPRRGHTTSLLGDGTVLVVGGDTGSGVTASCEIYDPATGQWAAADNLATARSDHAATTLPNGKVLITGGSDGSQALASCELYDPSTGHWGSAADLNTARAAHTASVNTSGGVVAVGGYDPGTNATFTSGEVYFPAGDAWLPLAGDLTTGRFDHTATVLPNGGILVAGGFNTATGFLDSAEVFDPTFGIWSPTTNVLADPRDRHSATLLPNGEVLVAGGRNGGGKLATAELYDPGTDTWSAAAPAAHPRENHTASLLPDGSLLLAGGNADGKAAISERYLYASDTWSPTGELSDGGLTTARADHTATLLPGGDVLVAGGFSPVAEIYPAPEGSWSTEASMATRRDNHTLTLLPDGRVLAAGGYGISFQELVGTEIFDPSTGSWSAGHPMPTARSVHTATLLANGKVLIAGGIVSNAPSATADLYDPVTATWSPLPPMAAAHNVHTATLLPDGRVLVAGSSTSSLVEIFDPISQAWSPTGSMVQPRYGHSATLLHDGRVLAVGGIPLGGGFQTTSTAEIYDPATGTWTPTAGTGVDRYLHAATLLPDGRVLVTGGSPSGGSGDAIADAEIYDPAGGTWTAVAPMNQIRRQHAALLLPNGRVMVIAGDLSGNSLDGLTSVEIYDPARDAWTEGGPLAVARARFPAVLLPDQTILISGGFNGGVKNETERYDPGLGYQPAWQPNLSSIELGPDGRLLLSGTGLRGISGASTGNARDSSTAYPLIQWCHLDSGRLFYLKTDPDPALPPFWPDAVRAASSMGLPLGYAMVTLVTNGIPGEPILYSPPGLEIERLGAGPVDGGMETLTAAAGSPGSVAYRVVNRGGTDLAGVAVSLAGADAGEFSIIEPPPATLGAGAREVFLVQFSPTRDGPKSASLSIQSSLPGTAIPGFSLQGEVHYTAAQVEALHVDTPLLRRNPAGDFTLTLGLQRSPDLERGNFTPFPMSPSATSIIDGKLEFSFSSANDTAFFLLQAE